MKYLSYLSIEKKENKVILSSIKDADNIGEAWEKSFEKWELLQDSSLYAGKIKISHSETCGLCNVYQGHNECRLCPIRTYTGYIMCINTPLLRYLIAPNPGYAKTEYQFLREVKDAG